MMKKLIMSLTLLSLGSSPALHSWPWWLGGGQKQSVETQEQSSGLIICKNCGRPKRPPVLIEPESTPVLSEPEVTQTHSEALLGNILEGFWQDKLWIAGACTACGIGNVARVWFKYQFLSGTMFATYLTSQKDAAKGVIFGAACGFGGSICKTLYNTEIQTLNGAAWENKENLFFLATGAVCFAVGKNVFWSKIQRWREKRSFIQFLKEKVNNRDANGKITNGEIVKHLPLHLANQVSLNKRADHNNTPTLLEKFINEYNKVGAEYDEDKVNQLINDIQTFIKDK